MTYPVEMNIARFIIPDRSLNDLTAALETCDDAAVSQNSLLAIAYQMLVDKGYAPEVISGR